jgi:diguanylate cyclase (GGDEF)-like protein
VARIRLVVIGSLVVVCLERLLQGGDGLVPQILSSLFLASFAGAWWIARSLRHPPVPRWLPMASSLLDVLGVGLALAVLALFTHPLAAANSFIFYPVLFLILAMTALRSDPRICLVGGAAVLAVHGLVVAFAYAHGRPGEAVSPFGGFNGTLQLERGLLLALMTVVSTAIVVRHRKMLHRSTRDTLTGLYSRGYFDALLRCRLAAARHRQEPLTVALLDLDHFKRFNDAHGHDYGDEALRRVASALAGSVRATDILGRRGGEEFAIVLPDTSLVAAGGVLERVRRRIEDTGMPGGEETTGREAEAHVTASIGAACWPQDGAGVEAILAVADRRLYEAKAAGRNRVVTGFGHAPRLRPAEREAGRVEAFPARVRTIAQP